MKTIIGSTLFEAIIVHIYTDSQFSQSDEYLTGCEYGGVKCGGVKYGGVKLAVLTVKSCHIFNRRHF